MAEKVDFASAAQAALASGNPIGSIVSGLGAGGPSAAESGDVSSGDRENTFNIQGITRGLSPSNIPTVAWVALGVLAVALLMRRK